MRWLALAWRDVARCGWVSFAHGVVLSGFGLALVLGGQRWATAEVEIYTLVAHELQLGQASVLAVWMLLLTGGVALGYAVLEKRLAAPGRVAPVPRQRPQGQAQWAPSVARCRRCCWARGLRC